LVLKCLNDCSRRRRLLHEINNFASLLFIELTLAAMGSEQHYHRRRRRRERRQTQQARPREEHATANPTTANANTDTTSSSSNSATTTRVTSNNPTNNVQSNSSHHTTADRTTTSTVAELSIQMKQMLLPSARTPRPKYNMISIDESDPTKPRMMVQYGDKKLYFIQTPTELTYGQQCFSMTSTGELQPCTIVALHNSCGQYNINVQLDKLWLIECNVHHSQLWIRESTTIEPPKPTIIVQHAGKEFYITQSQAELTTGQTCFRMTSTGELQPCSIISRINTRKTNVIKYDIVLGKQGGIEHSVDHSQLWIRQSASSTKPSSAKQITSPKSIKPSPTKQAQNIKKPRGYERSKTTLSCGQKCYYMTKDGVLLASTITSSSINEIGTIIYDIKLDEYEHGLSANHSELYIRNNNV